MVKQAGREANFEGAEISVISFSLGNMFYKTTEVKRKAWYGQHLHICLLTQVAFVGRIGMRKIILLTTSNVEAEWGRRGHPCGQITEIKVITATWPLQTLIYQIAFHYYCLQLGADDTLGQKILSRVTSMVTTLQTHNVGEDTELEWICRVESSSSFWAFL